MLEATANLLNDAASNTSDIVSLSLTRGTTEVGTSVQWWTLRNSGAVSNQTFSIFMVSQPVAFAIFSNLGYSVYAALRVMHVTCVLLLLSFFFLPQHCSLPAHHWLLRCAPPIAGRGQHL